MQLRYKNVGPQCQWGQLWNLAYCRAVRKCTDRLSDPRPSARASLATSLLCANGTARLHLCSQKVVVFVWVVSIVGFAVVPASDSQHAAHRSRQQCGLALLFAPVSVTAGAMRGGCAGCHFFRNLSTTFSCTPLVIESASAMRTGMASLARFRNANASAPSCFWSSTFDRSGQWPVTL